MEYHINIIVPVYNVEEYLPDFFESMKRQTYQSFRLFVVDDSSKDKSREIIISYKQYFGDRLIYIFNDKNVKQGASRNIGLDEAEKYESEYTTFIDSDDWVDDDFLESMYFLGHNNDVDLVICGIRRFEDKTNKEICIEAVNGNKEVCRSLAFCDDIAYINPAPYNKLYKSKKIKGYRFKTNMKRSEDTCYFMEILPSISSMVYTKKPSYHYRLRDNSLTGSFDFSICESMFTGFRELYKKEYSNERYDDFREMLESQIFIRTAVGGVARASFCDMKRAGEYIKKTIEFMDCTMPNWRQNKYLTFRRLPGGIKELSLPVLATMYKLHCYKLFLLVYYFIVIKLRIDIRM